jgi:NADP-dependent 3-hydroxy acid dehydrogenase YdfG
MPSLKDKVVIVTGASSGIGYETALAFAREGTKSVLAARREERLRELAGRIEALGGEALVVPTDVSKREQVERLVQAAVDRFGRVDVMVNNAGFGLGATIEQTTDQDFRDLWETNVLGVLYGMQAVLPVMRRQSSGHIVNVSSAAGRIAYPGIGAYSATKSAIVALTDALRAEMADAGIRASVVLPIGTRTEFFEAARLIDGTPVGPHGPTQSAEHVAQRIVGCARRPTVEVIPFRPLRLGVVLHALFPALLSFIGRRAYRQQSQRQASRLEVRGR